MVGKRLSAIVFTAFSVILLCSCGVQSTDSDTATPSFASDSHTATSEPTVHDVADSPLPEQNAPDPSAESNVLDPEGRKEIAISLIGQDVGLLYEALGEPLSAEYSLSCNGPGDDGLLTYDGFIVFTYREDGVETVFDVL